MSDKNQEFWKELMGEDFKVDLDPEPVQKPQTPPPASSPAANSSPATGGPQGGDEPFIDGSPAPLEPGFTIEYIRRDDPAAPHLGQKPAEPIQRPVQPAQKPAEPTQRPVQSAQKPAGPTQRPVQPAQRPAEPVQRPIQPVDSTRVVPPVTPDSLRTPRAGADRSEPPRAPEPAVEKGKSSRRKSKDDFEVEFDFDSEYADVDEKAIRRGRTKRTGCLSGILIFILVICVSAVLACVGWIWATDVLGLDGEDVPVEVTLPEDYFHTEKRSEEGDDGEKVEKEVSVVDIDKVAEELYQKGLIKYRWLFKLYVKLSDSDEMMKAGTYTLNMVYDYRAIVHGMTGARSTRDTTTLVIPEGYSITQIVDLLVDNGVCQRQELLDTLKDYDFDYDFLDKSTLGQEKRLEGYLFPDTYEFYVGDDPVNVIRKFLNNFDKKWEDDFDALAEEQGYTRHEILIIASMIEKEAGSDDERDLISSVIYNRLRHPDRQGTNGFLQINATIYYVIADTGEEYSTDIDSPYNTYRYPGLPAGPIANPGIASIRAALQPRNTSYYYYALGKNKTHRFFETYREFTNFVNSDEYGGNQ